LGTELAGPQTHFWRAYIKRAFATQGKFPSTEAALICKTRASILLDEIQASARYANLET
jgi:hypothetical protein